MGRTDGQRLRSRVVHRRVRKRSLPSCSGAAAPPQHYSAVYKSLPCRGAFGCGGCGAAPDGVPASGTGSAPINTLGGWGMSMSRWLFRRLFLRSRSFTPRSLAIPHRENCQRHYTSGDTLYFRGTDWRWWGVSAHSDEFSVCMANCDWGTTGAVRVSL